MCTKIQNQPNQPTENAIELQVMTMINQKKPEIQGVKVCVFMYSRPVNTLPEIHQRLLSKPDNQPTSLSEENISKGDEGKWDIMSCHI